MNLHNRYYCMSCYNLWDDKLYIPKMLDCGHSLCVKCLQRLLQNNQIICPEDMKSFRVTSIAQLRTNQELLQPQILQSTRSTQQEVSYSEIVTQSITRENPSIRKPINVHLINQVPWTRQQLEQWQQQLNEAHQQFDLNQQATYNEAYRLITQQKRYLTDQIQQKFTELQIKLRNTESLVLQQLNMSALQLEDDIRQMHLRLDKRTIQQMLSIKERIDQLLLLNNEKLNQQVDLIHTLSQQAQQAIQQIKNQETSILEEQITNSLIIEFDFTIYDVLPTFCNLKKNTPNKQQDHSRRVKTAVDLSHSFSPKVDYSKPYQYSKNASHIEEFDRPNHRQTFGKDLRKSQEQLRKSHDSIRSNSQTKLKDVKNMDRIEDQLFKGLPIDKLDLTNQNLNDQNVQQLINLIKQSSSSIGCIKLSKNHITDTGFSKLLTLTINRSDIHTLNLSNNDCTEQSIEMIERRLPKLQGKTFYLTDCKIANLKKLKQKQNSFENRGVALYL